MLLYSFAAALVAVVGAIAAPTDTLSTGGFASMKARQVSRSEEGYNNGQYYWFWSDGLGKVNFTRQSEVQYSVHWNDSGNFIGGVGWNPGTARNIDYKAEFAPEGNGYLAAYGWTDKPNVEYYVIDSYGTYVPTENEYQYVGSVDSDGGTYKIYKGIRVGPGLGDITYRMFWSVRTERRVSGTITLKNHFDAWAALGMQLGVHARQLMAVEGYYSSGIAKVQIATG